MAAAIRRRAPSTIAFTESPVCAECLDIPGLVNVNKKLLKMAIYSGFTH